MYKAMIALLVAAALAAGCAGGVSIGGPKAGQVPVDAGVLALKSNVSGADVYIDGNLVGTVTKAASRQSFVVPGGEHELVVKRFAYQDWKQQILVTPGATNTIDVYLERQPARTQ